MRIRSLEYFNIWLLDWGGSEANINFFSESHDVLVLGLFKPENDGRRVGIGLTGTVYLSGPARWRVKRLVCRIVTVDTGNQLLEVADSDDTFVARCEGPISVAGQFIIKSASELESNLGTHDLD